MKSMITNDVWDLEVIPNGAKIVGCKGSKRWNVTPKEICKDTKHDLYRKDLRKENEYITMSVNGTLRFELHHVDAKTSFLNGGLYEMFTWHNPRDLSWKEKNVRDVA
jgi:hypothetical protein